MKSSGFFTIVSSSFVLLFVALAVQSANADIVLGQIDAFTSGTADGWQEGNSSPNPPAYDGGAGADGMAGHLGNVSSGGGGAGSRWLMWNDDTRWAGDYSSQNIDAIILFADNRSGNGNAADLRIALDGGGGWFVSNAFTLADGSGWSEVEYMLANLTHVSGSGGTGVLADTLSSVSRFEIVSTTSPLYRPNGDVIQGDAIELDIRIDNIRAVPEPGTTGMITMLALVGLVRRKQ